MKTFINGTRRWLCPLAAVALLSVLLLLVYSWTTGDPHSPPSVEPALAVGAPHRYYGPVSLGELIVGSDVIARVRLHSVSSGADSVRARGQYDTPTGDTVYVRVINFTFDVLEYLKGSGGNRIVAVVNDLDAEFKTKQLALSQGKDIGKDRDVQWDDREAIVFLQEWRKDYVWIPSSVATKDYYSLGFVYEGQEYFSIFSTAVKRWLPAALVQGTGSGQSSDGSGEKWFLTDVPSATASAGAATDATVETPSIALSALKSNVAKFEKMVADGGDSKDYRRCILEALEWERQAARTKEIAGGKYPHIRYDHTISSGLAAETTVFEDPFGMQAIASGGKKASKAGDQWGEYGIVYGDSALFDVNYPGLTSVKRPLPADTYNFYLTYVHNEYLICDGMPEDEKKRRELFLTVTAPSGTVHEAFFDPASTSLGVGFQGSQGVLSPASFTHGDAASSIVGLGWEDGEVTLVLSPYVSLAGKTLDFIELDGTVSLSLGFDDGVSGGESGTVVWGVDERPWESGDRLMIRIR